MALALSPIRSTLFEKETATGFLGQKREGRLIREEEHHSAQNTPTTMVQKRLYKQNITPVVPIQSAAIAMDAAGELRFQRKPF